MRKYNSSLQQIVKDVYYSMQIYTVHYPPNVVIYIIIPKMRDLHEKGIYNRRRPRRTDCRL